MQPELLQQTRNTWYQAFFAGDILKLQTIELPEFAYISAQGIETTATRYNQIAHKLNSNTWFPNTAYREELSAHTLQLRNSCFITGLAKIVITDDNQHQRYFSELWQWHEEAEQGQWRIASLHATVVPE